MKSTAQSLGVVLHSTQQQWGGGEQWLWSLGQGLRKQGIRVHWIVPKTSALAQRLGQSSYLWLPISSKGWSLRDLRAIRNFVKTTQSDVVHLNDSHAVTGATFALVGCTRIARVWTKHTTFPLRGRYKYQWGVDRVLCVSRAAQQTVIECGIRPEQTALIYGAVDEPQLDPFARQILLRELNWGPESRLIVCVGNLLACKGHRHVVEAMPAVLSEHPTARLIIAGEGEERSALEQLVADLQLHQVVKLLGFRSDATRLLSAADVVVQPSLAEALSLVAIESQMLLKPLVATAVGGLAEVVCAKSDSPVAELVQPGSSSDLARGVNAVLGGGDEQKHRCRRAKVAADERFSMSRMVNDVLELYRAVIRARQGDQRLAKTANAKIPTEGSGIP
jgi:glycosyltransferase involved in cell wall biosynthesis